MEVEGKITQKGPGFSPGPTSPPYRRGVYFPPPRAEDLVVTPSSFASSCAGQTTLLPGAKTNSQKSAPNAARQDHRQLSRQRKASSAGSSPASIRSTWC